jgi:hypothetical protein
MRTFLAILFTSLRTPTQAQTHVIEVLADKVGRCKIAGAPTPEITVKAGELRGGLHRDL